MRTIASAFALALPFAALGCSGASSDATDPVESTNEALSARDEGAVFTTSNAAAANTVVAFRRAADGALTPAGETPTGGRGTGAGLGSQGALALTDDGRFLLVVNAGSNDVSSFAVRGASLELRARVGSGGTTPISVAAHGGLVYVLNEDGVSGFHLSGGGGLTPIPGAMRPLSAASAGPAQVSFAPDGRALVVTEKATNAIDTFAVRSDGALRPAVTTPSSGATPYGFAFTGSGSLVVSEAFGGAPGAGAVSSYRLNHDPDGDGDRDRDLGLDVVSRSIPDHQGAPCWVVVTRDGRYAYTSNAASGSVSGYRVASRGELTLLDAGGVTGDAGAGSQPTDMAFERATRALYVLSSGTHEIALFHRADDGSLGPVASRVSVPATAVGLAAR